MASIERTAFPRLDKALSKSELRARYGVSTDEHPIIGRSAKGKSQILTLCVLLKTRQQIGYFPKLSDVPKQITRYLAKQLRFSVKIKLLGEKNLRTSRNRYRNIIRKYLGSKPYTSGGKKCVTIAVRAAAYTMSDPADLINVAVEELTKTKVELPAFSTLERLVANIRHEIHKELYTGMTENLSPEQENILNALLIVPSGSQNTLFTLLKQSPGTPTLNHVRLWTEQLDKVEAILDPSPFLQGVSHTKIRQFAAKAEALQVHDMLNIHQPGKRHALLLCLLQHTRARVRDELAEMFIRRMRRTKKMAKDKLQHIREQHRDVEESLVSTLGKILHKATGKDVKSQELGNDVMNIFETEGGTEYLLKQYQTISAFHQNNYLPLLWAIHSRNRSVLFKLLKLLKIKSTNQDSSLVDALEYILKFQHSRQEFLPFDIDLNFVSHSWQNFIIVRRNKGQVLNRRHLEVGVFMYISSALDQADIYIENSETYSDPRSQLLSWEECELRLADYCSGVGLPTHSDDFLLELQNKLSLAANKTDGSFPDNSELTIDDDGKAHLKRQKKASSPGNLKVFQDEVRARMPERHLLDILKNTNSWSGFTRHFGPPSGSEPKISDAVRRYIFAIFGNGCFVGDSQTARHGPSSIDRQILGRINSQHINIEKLEAALKDLVNEYARFSLPNFWGKGLGAITDGTHIDLTENNLMGEQHIRYGGYGGIAYHHIADNYVALFCNFIACGVWEAVYIFDGLLKNSSEIQPNTLYADTHGQSEPVFGLAHVLGIQLFPRMRNWNDVTFYRPTKESQYTHINELFTDTIDWELIRRHWKDIMQIVISIQAGKVLPSMILRRLGSKSRKNKLYLAFRELGRVERTVFLLRYISEYDFRFSIRAETTKIESFHSFMAWIAFGGTVIKSGDPVEQSKRMKYMDVVANAIMLQNVADLTEVLHTMSKDGFTITTELVSSLSPYIRGHILRFGQWALNMEDPPSPLEPKPVPVSV